MEEDPNGPKKKGDGSVGIGPVVLAAAAAQARKVEAIKPSLKAKLTPMAVTGAFKPMTGVGIK